MAVDGLGDKRVADEADVPWEIVDCVQTERVGEVV